MSEWTSSIIDPFNELTDEYEVISSEEMCGFMDILVEDARKEGKETRNWVILSLDAVGLYPALNIKQCSKVVAERVASSDMKIEGIDFKWAATYVALAMDENDVTRKGLHDIIPRRRSRCGTKATIKGLWHWQWMKMTLSEEDSRT